MKLTYIANARIPTEKAHGIQIMKMCEAFALVGAKVELLVPRRRNTISTEPFSFYNVSKIFSISKIFSLDVVRWGAWGFRLQSLTFSLAVFLRMLFLNKMNLTQDLIYSRDELPLFLLSFFTKNLVWEAHMGHLNFFVKRLIRKGIKIVVITEALKDFYVKKGADVSCVCVASDGVDLKSFSTGVSKEKAREILGFKKDAKLVMYTGHLYEWKGADTLVEAARLLDPSTLVIFVGGTEKHIASFKRRYERINNVESVGHKPYRDMPLYLRSADVLVLPNTAKEDLSRLYTSPMKLFEYMASGRPIVASDIPSLREMVTEKEVFFFEADNSRSLADSIENALARPREAEAKGQQAALLSNEYSWENRANRIMQFIS